MTSYDKSRDDRHSEIAEITALQAGVISRSQALGCGMPADAVDRLLRSRRWQQLHRGIYLAFTGEPSREAELWAAVKYGGQGAALSHQTAAELFGLIVKRDAAIHLTIPESRRKVSVAGIVMHRSSRIVDAIHPTLLPPRTRIEDTVLDLAEQARTFDAAFGSVCGACQRGLTTADRISVAMARRKKMAWRKDLTEALGLISTGTHSLLEYRYVRLVERPHGLPVANRQAKVVEGGHNRYLDNLYSGYHLSVELDGQLAHPEHQRWSDQRRANAITARGITILRYGWADVHSRPCQTAAEIARVLRSLGWRGSFRLCKRDCQVP